MKNNLRLIGIICLIWALLDIVLTIKQEPYYVIFWFSNSIFLLLSIGFLFRDRLLVSSIAIAAVITETGWVLDFVTRLITTHGLFAAPITEYMFTRIGFASIRFYIELSHVAVIPLALYGAYKLGMHKKAYLLCFGYSVFFNLLAYFFASAEYNINCAHYLCFLSANPHWIPQPYYLIIWIFVPVIFAALPLNYLFSKWFPERN